MCVVMSFCCRGSRRWIVLIALAAGGCYQVHMASEGRPAGDASIDTRHVDGGNIDSDARDAEHADSAVDAPGDAASDGRPVEPAHCSSVRGCYCFPEIPAGSGGRCLTPTADDDNNEVCYVGHSCSRADRFCNDLGGGEQYGTSTWGMCVERSTCIWLFEHDSLFTYTPLCFYEDGSEVQGRERARTECPAEGAAGTLCGPACNECERGRVCVGLSERSGLGLCVRPPTTSSPDRCAEDMPLCSGADGCLRFVVPADITTVGPSDVWGACVPRAECHRVAEAHPERFRCEAE